MENWRQQFCSGCTTLPERDAIIVKQALSSDILNLEAATEVICSRTLSQIQLFKQHYHAKFGIHLEHDIQLYTSGDHKRVLHKAMKGLGTKDITLMRVIVMRTEIDMQLIKVECLKKLKKTLNDAVHSETSGHYRPFLLSLLGPKQ